MVALPGSAAATDAALAPPPPLAAAAPSPAPKVLKKKAIRLPFHVSYLPSAAIAKTQRLCGICRANPSPYACPRCQVPYCSLACYQDPQKHAQCSEPFYKDEVERDLRASSSSGAAGGKKAVSKEEQDTMVDMLRRFEEGAGGEGPLEWDEEDGGPEDEGDGLDELAELLDSAGLDGVQTEDLLSMLPPELRSQFLASVATSSASAQPSAVLQTLLESAELRSAEHSPWWLADTDLGGALDLDGPFEAVRAPKASTRAPPELVQVPAGVRPSVDVAQRVMFNIAAVAIAYVHSTLTFRRSPLSEPSSDPAAAADLTGPVLDDARAALDHLLSLVPFVEEQKSTVLLGSFKEARLYSNSHLESTSILPPKILAAHITPLLRPPSPVVLADAAPPPHPLILALSDLHRLLTQTASPSTRAAHRRAHKKLEFFSACVGLWERDEWLALAEQVDKTVRWELLEQTGDVDDDETEAFVASAPTLPRVAAAHGGQEPPRPAAAARKIEVLGGDDGDDAPLAPAFITEIEEDTAAAARLDP